MDSIDIEDSVAVMAVRDAPAGGIEVRVSRGAGVRDCWAAKGRIRNVDSAARVLARCRGVTEAIARRYLGQRKSPQRGMGHWVTASRELFIRTGVLFGTQEDGQTPIAPETRSRLAARRFAVEPGAFEFAHLLESEHVFCDLRALVPFAQWFDNGSPKNTRTQIFLAGFSRDSCEDSGNPEEGVPNWVAPEVILVERQRTQIPLNFVTYSCLRTLSDFQSIEEYRAGIGY
jgi:hypothetical protein